MEAHHASTDKAGDNLTGLARSLKRGAWFQCDFEQLATNRVVVHLPENLHLREVDDMVNALRDHIEVTHIDATTIHLQTDHPTFAE